MARRLSYRQHAAPMTVAVAGTRPGSARSLEWGCCARGDLREERRHQRKGVVAVKFQSDLDDAEAERRHAAGRAPTTIIPSTIVGLRHLVAVGTSSVAGIHPAPIESARPPVSAKLASDVTSTTRPVTRSFSCTVLARRFHG